MIAVFKVSPMLVEKKCIFPVMMVVFVLFSFKLLSLHNSIFIRRTAIPSSLSIKEGNCNN